METKKQRNKLIANLVFFIVVIIVLGVIVFNLNDVNDIISHTKDAKIEYLLVAVLFLLIHMTLTNLSMHNIQRKVINKLPFFISMNVANSEYLFNAITPFSSGGQPVQAYYLMKHGMTGEESASVLVSNFTIYQFVLTIFSTIGLIVFFPRINATISAHALIIIIGYVINTLILVGLILVATLDSFKKLLKGFFRLLGKIKILKKSMIFLEERTFGFVEAFQKGTKHLLSNKGVLIGSVILRVIDLIILNSIPIFIFLALNVNIEINDIWFIIMMTAFASTFMMWVPTPGATGGVEWAFTVLFVGVIASSSVVVTAMLFWRSITYFLALILGFMSYLIIRRKGD